MNLLKQIERLRQAHKLILNGQTGTPKEFAMRLHISERRLFDIIDDMRSMGAPIQYSRIQKTYYYEFHCIAELYCNFKSSENI